MLKESHAQGDCAFCCEYVLAPRLRHLRLPATEPTIAPDDTHLIDLVSEC